MGFKIGSDKHIVPIKRVSINDSLLYFKDEDILTLGIMFDSDLFVELCFLFVSNVKQNKDL